MEILLITSVLGFDRRRLDERVREESHECRLFSHREEVGLREGKGESGMHIFFTHGEEKIWRRTGFLVG